MTTCNEQTQSDFETVRRGITHDLPVREVALAQEAATRLHAEAAKVPGLEAKVAELEVCAAAVKAEFDRGEWSTAAGYREQVARAERAESERDAARERSVTLEQTERDLSGHVVNLEKVLAAERESLRLTRENVDALRERVATLEAELNATHAKYTGAVNACGSVGARLQTAEARVKELTEKLATMVEHCDRLYQRHRQEATDERDENTRTAHRYAMGVAETLGGIARGLGAQPAPTPAHVVTARCPTCGRTWTRPTRCGDCDRNSVSVPLSPAQVGVWRTLLDAVERLRKPGHDGDEETGQHDEACEGCAWDAIQAMAEDARATLAPTPTPGLVGPLVDAARLTLSCLAEVGMERREDGTPCERALLGLSSALSAYDAAQGGEAACSMKGRCHGSLAHCDACGDVGLLCDMEGSCDLHRERWTEWVLERSEVARAAREEGHATGRAEARKELQEEVDKANAFVSEARRQAAQDDEALFHAGLKGGETLDKARVVEVLTSKWDAAEDVAAVDAAVDSEAHAQQVSLIRETVESIATDLGLTLDAPPSGPGGGEEDVVVLGPDEDVPEKCENCPAPSTHRDSEGVLLCDDCHPRTLSNHPAAPESSALPPQPIHVAQADGTFVPPLPVPEGPALKWCDDEHDWDGRGADLPGDGRLEAKCTRCPAVARRMRMDSRAYVIPERPMAEPAAPEVVVEFVTLGGVGEHLRVLASGCLEYQRGDGAWGSSVNVAAGMLARALAEAKREITELKTVQQEAARQAIRRFASRLGDDATGYDKERHLEELEDSLYQHVMDEEKKARAHALQQARDVVEHAKQEAVAAHKLGAAETADSILQGFDRLEVRT